MFLASSLSPRWVALSIVTHGRPEVALWEALAHRTTLLLTIARLSMSFSLPALLHKIYLCICLVVRYMVVLTGMEMEMGNMRRALILLLLTKRSPLRPVMALLSS